MRTLLGLAGLALTFGVLAAPAAQAAPVEQERIGDRVVKTVEQEVEQEIVEQERVEQE